MVTHSPIDALPLGLIITSDETTSTLLQAFDLFKLCLSEESFYGKGKDGPSILMTDNFQELRDALSNSWPRATLKRNIIFLHVIGPVLLLFQKCCLFSYPRRNGGSLRRI